MTIFLKGIFIVSILVIFCNNGYSFIKLDISDYIFPAVGSVSGSYEFGNKLAENRLAGGSKISFIGLMNQCFLCCYMDFIKTGSGENCFPIGI